MVDRHSICHLSLYIEGGCSVKLMEWNDSVAHNRSLILLFRLGERYPHILGAGNLSNDVTVLHFLARCLLV